MGRWYLQWRICLKFTLVFPPFSNFPTVFGDPVWGEHVIHVLSLSIGESDCLHLCIIDSPLKLVHIWTLRFHRMATWCHPHWLVAATLHISFESSFQKTRFPTIGSGLVDDCEGLFLGLQKEQYWWYWWDLEPLEGHFGKWRHPLAMSAYARKFTEGIIMSICRFWPETETWANGVARSTCKTLTILDWLISSSTSNSTGFSPMAPGTWLARCGC